MPDFRHWTLVVIEMAAFISVSIWAFRSVAREIKNAYLELRTQKHHQSKKAG
jgi:hypothetical protein